MLETSALFGITRERAARVAAAVECVHAYSLVHDDLPAMDDDDLRRGKPTAHRAFDEATAILAGDALLTFAFELVGSPETHEDPLVRCELVTHLAQAIGHAGMIAGQMIDMALEGAAAGLPEITRLQSLKTGALIAYCCEAGAILAGGPPGSRNAVKDYGRDLGLAFQIADDLLDAEGTAAETGKKVGKDAERGKATFISVMGIELARKEARTVADRAASRLDLFGAAQGRFRPWFDQAARRQGHHQGLHVPEHRRDDGREDGNVRRPPAAGAPLIFALERVPA